MGRFLILQLRPEAEASDDEYQSILKKSGLHASDTLRVSLDREDLPEDLTLSAFDGTIVGGGPGCVSDAPEDKTPTEARIETAVLGLMPEITERDLPFMGCCYGIGILGHHLGAPVGKSLFGESVGGAACVVTDVGKTDPILDGVPDRFTALVGHKEAVEALPENCTHLVQSATCPLQMIRHGQNVYATQFHPEADADNFELRIRLYKDKGYFDPSQADALIQNVHALDTTAPPRILRNFVDRYRR
ncbi:MAG: glutamine amidotransferase [Pseudomonadota bacterium]